MPAPEQILNGLSDLANDWRGAAVIWHVCFAALVLALALVAGLRPPVRLAGILLSLPVFGVSALAWVSSNFFNGTVFAALGAASVLVTARR